MNETAFKTKAMAHLRERGAYVVKNWGSPLSRAGVPDLLVGFRGRFIAFELKAPGVALDRENGPENDRYAEPAQQRALGFIRDAGCQGWVVNSLDQINAALDDILVSIGETQKPLVSSVVLAERLGTNKGTITRLREAGRIKGYKLSDAEQGQWRYDVEEVLGMLRVEEANR